MKNWAVIVTGKVFNVIRYDGSWQTTPAGWTLVELADGEACGIGWLYAPGSSPRFIEPEE